MTAELAFDEHAHPRDKDGQFIKRLGQVRLSNGRSAIVVDAEPSARGTIQVKDNKSGEVKTVKANTVEAIGDHGASPKGSLPAAPALETRDYEGRVGDTSHITRVQTGRVPTSAIAHLMGKAGETPGAHRNRQGARWDQFRDDVKQNGVQRPIFITVDPGEAPKISEGNHRRDAAVETDQPDVPVEIRYYGHAERDSGGPADWMKRSTAAPAAVDWSKPNVDITTADQEALHKYGWDQHSYQEINAGLRTDGRVPPANQPLVDEMTSLIDRAELPADTTLHRHTYIEPSSNVNLLDELRQAQSSGGTWTDKGFMSTSLSREHADDMDAGTPDEALKMEIHAPKGSKALVWGNSIADMPGAYDQQEVTLQRGSQFKVDRISQDRDGTTRVRLSLVGAEPDAPAEPEPDTSYRMDHQPGIDTSTSESLDDLSKMYDDIYEHPEYYSGSYNGPPGDEFRRAARESFAAIKSMRGKPDAMVTIYRAAPPGVATINRGDWITLSPTYAEIHARQDNDESHDWPVHSVRVPASSVRWDGNDLNEFGYAGPSTPVERSGQIRNGAYVNDRGMHASARPEGAETIDSAGGGGVHMVAAFDTTALVAAGTCSGPGPCDVHPLGHGKNWVTEEGGLPNYIRAIAHAMERQGHDKSSAIRNAIGAVKRWASGGGGVSAGTRARAAKALAEWEAKKASAHAHSIESDKALIGQVPETVAASALEFSLTEMALGDLADLTAEFGVMGVDGGPTHAGLCMKAADTGRVLMLQRALDDPTDPAAGKWEFPGGGHEDGDATSLHTAIREWQEEVGQPFPKNVLVAGVWSAPNGVYQGHIVLVPDESVVSPAEGRMYPNPDDPDGDNSESVAWWHPDDAAANPALREEAKLTPWDTIKAAGFTLPTSADADDGNDVEPDGDPDDSSTPADDNEKNRVLLADGAFEGKHPRGAGGKFAPLNRGAGYDTSSAHGQRQNDRVKHMQQALTDLGYSVGPEGVDGMLGPHTAAGIRDFQRTNGLDATGVIDQATHHALLSGNAKRNTGSKGSRGSRSHGHAASRFVPTPVKGVYAMDDDNIDLDSFTRSSEPPSVDELQAAGPIALMAFSLGTLEAAGPAFALTAEDRRKAANAGTAMSDGSYPIRNESELSKAVRAFPRGAGNGKTKTGIKRHIMQRARALKKESALPQSWSPKTAAAELPALVASAEDSGDWMPVLAAAVTEVPPVDVPEQVGGGVPFRIPILLPTGIESGDRREFKADGVEHRDLPIPLYWQKTTDDGHKASVIVARIDSINKIKDGLGDAEGEFDNSPEAEEALRLVRGLFLRGVSADVDKVDAEMSKADDGKPKVTFNEGRVTAATLVGKPAFAECMIELPGDKEWEQNMANLRANGDQDGPQPIAAAGGPMFPSSDWFADPNLSEPTPLTVTDDGRVFGHLASWDTDHIGMPFQKPPRSKSGYRYFATGQLKTAEGDFVNVGQLTLLGGHADLSLSADAAIKHYDDTNSAVADVVVGEDAFGIWAAGAMRPGLTDMQMRQFRASKPSGDWRPIGNNLELVACLQVNTPGFPVPRARVASAGVGGPVITALVAAGAVMDRPRTTHADLADRVARLEAQRRIEIATELRATVASAKAIEADELRRRVKAAAHGDEEGE